MNQICKTGKPFKLLLLALCLCLSMSVMAQQSEAEELYAQGISLTNQGDYAGAAVYFEKALPYVEKFGEEYEQILTYLSRCYIETNDQDGIARVLALVDEHNRHELEKDCNEPTCMKERAEYYALKGDNVAAKECYLTALSMDMTEEEKADVYYSYAMYIWTNQDFSSGAEYFLMSANAKKTLNGVTDEYISTIYTTASSYFLAECYDEAIKFYQEVIDYYSKINSQEAREKMAQSHKGIGASLSGQKKYAEAEVECQEVVDYYKQYDPSNDEYPKAIVSLANAEKFNKDYDSSIAHYHEALSIYAERGMTEEYDNTSNSLKLCYAYAGRASELSEEGQSAMEEQADEARKKKLDSMIKDELDNLELYHTYLGELSYANSLATIAGCYYLKEDYDNAVNYYKQYIASIRDAVRDEFRLQNESERMILWNSQIFNIDEILDILANLPQDKGNLFPELSAIAYDAMLLSKGILLNSSIEFEKVLSEAGDKHLQEVYQQTKQNEAEMERLRASASTNEDMERILTLSRQNQTLQLELYKGCAEYSDFTDYISYSWQDVQKAMESGDVAIEFVEIKTGALDDDNYLVALVLTNEATSPIALPICNLVIAKRMANDNNLFDAPVSIWTVLQQYLEGKKRVFFSADGVLNNIGIEYLQYDGKPLSEQKEVYRLSSTKELCRHHNVPSIENVAIFGGIDYYAVVDVQDSIVRQLKELSSGNRGESLRGKFINLKNTLREAEDIQRICEDKKIPNILLLTAKEASESAFRMLDYSNINLLHIATHGMYDDVSGASETESMENSVLAFAGVNVGGDKTPDNDGIVTAADVAQMNLRQCSLAVLSACETGLGKLGEDGVFGLQRGFKNAGTQTLLMSLRPVDDAATTELMVSFYRHMMSGKSKHEALSLAQQELRDKGYKESKYWATFILLDATD